MLSRYQGHKADSSIVIMGFEASHLQSSPLDSTKTKDRLSIFRFLFISVFRYPPVINHGNGKSTIFQLFSHCSKASTCNGFPIAMFVCWEVFIESKRHDTNSILSYGLGRDFPKSLLGKKYSIYICI